MHRRNFIHRTGMCLTAGLLTDSLSAHAEDVAQRNPAEPAAQPRKALMKVGHQNNHSTEGLNLMAGLGVNHICSGLPSARFDENWSVEALKKFRERIEGFGIRLEMLPLPLSSYYITRAENPNIMLGKSPERDREIDNICQMIRNAALAGIPALKYNMSILGVVSTDSIKCRGKAVCRAFDYSKARQDPPLTEAGPVDPETYWERIRYFLMRVIPVAEEYKVRMACHPHDPGMPLDKGFRGVHTVLGSVAGLKRFIEITPSKYHGLNFCQGTVSEMLSKPGEQIYDVIHYFGSRGKIFNVHFRNIRGGFLNFMETFIDDGDVDMLKAMRVYKEVGYDGMIMPDHVPLIAGDQNGLHAFAYTFGYIKALIA
ncbi:MAG: mannonate dehydratase, partial [Blastocatellia bacterium]|nr:mannonate dehydratase [Blastocatellia bacterium]